MIVVRLLCILTQFPYRESVALHLAALRDYNIKIRHILASVSRLGGLHLLDDVHAVDDLAEDDMFAVEEGCGHGGDEELGAVGVGAGILWKVISRDKALDCVKGLNAPP